MSKFELNPTVNELGKSILLKIHHRPASQGTRPATQNTRNDVKHHSFINIWTPNSEIYQN